MTVENSTVTAPVSLYAITFINTISPIATRPNVPGTTISANDILQKIITRIKKNNYNFFGLKHCSVFIALLLRVLFQFITE